MEIAKIFQNGRSQAVRLPKEYRFSDDEVYVKKVGNVVMLYPKEQVWETFVDGVNSFTDDFMANGRDQGEHQERDPL